MARIHIGDIYLEKPIIQGGMGIGVSRSSFAGAVAREDGMGVISTAQIGYDVHLFREKPEVANLQVLPIEIKKAKYIAGNRGMVAVNIMSVTQLYGVYVKEAVKAGADAVISGAGFPVELPEHVEGTTVKIAPVVSSKKAADIIMKIWDKRYQRAADFLIMESPYSGGHQGYRKEDLEDLERIRPGFEEDVRQTIGSKKQYEEKMERKFRCL